MNNNDMATLDTVYDWASLASYPDVAADVERASDASYVGIIVGADSDGRDHIIVTTATTYPDEDAAYEAAQAILEAIKEAWWDTLDLAVDSAHGIYIPRVWAERFGAAYEGDPSIVPALLTSDPSSQDYWEAWWDVLSGEHWVIGPCGDVLYAPFPAPAIEGIAE